MKIKQAKRSKKGAISGRGAVAGKKWEEPLRVFCIAFSLHDCPTILEPGTSYTHLVRGLKRSTVMTYFIRKSFEVLLSKTCVVGM